MKLILKWFDILDVSSGKVIELPVQKVHKGKCRIISETKDFSCSDKFMYGKRELGSHSDTTVAGANFCKFQYTGK